MSEDIEIYRKHRYGEDYEKPEIVKDLEHSIEVLSEIDDIEEIEWRMSFPYKNFDYYYDEAMKEYINTAKRENNLKLTGNIKFDSEVLANIF